jgi:hypothetical protein
MAKGFKSGGRQTGSKNKPKELMVTSIERAAVAGNARVQAKVIPTLKLTPLEMMLANMEWAWDEAAVMLKDITRDPNISGEAKLEAYKELLRLRDRVQRYAEKAAPYVHPKLHAVAPTAAPEETDQVEVDPLREHIREMARHFNLAVPNGG